MLRKMSCPHWNWIV